MAVDAKTRREISNFWWLWKFMGMNHPTCGEYYFLTDTLTYGPQRK